jgi:hypothetical protein
MDGHFVVEADGTVKVDFRHASAGETPPPPQFCASTARDASASLLIRRQQNGVHLTHSRQGDSP